MARIVCVHGVGKQLSGEQSLLQAWMPALADGLKRAGVDQVAAGDVVMAFYGDLFRPAGEWLAAGDPRYGAKDVEPGWEQELLFAWWREAAAVDARVGSHRQTGTLVLICSAARNSIDEPVGLTAMQLTRITTI